jgi:hypothetical protein
MPEFSKFSSFSPSASVNHSAGIFCWVMRVPPANPGEPKIGSGGTICRAIHRDTWGSIQADLSHIRFPGASRFSILSAFAMSPAQGTIQSRVVGHPNGHLQLHERGLRDQWTCRGERLFAPIRRARARRCRQLWRR